MIIQVYENIFGVDVVRLQEVDKMKCRCSICVLWYGNAPKTDNLKLKVIDGRYYLVCRGHYKITSVDRRRQHETRNNLN